MNLKKDIEEKLFNKWWFIETEKMFIYPYSWDGSNRILCYCIYHNKTWKFMYSGYIISSLIDTIIVEVGESRSHDLNTILSKKMLLGVTSV